MTTNTKVKKEIVKSPNDNKIRIELAWVHRGEAREITIHLIEKGWISIRKTINNGEIEFLYSVVDKPYIKWIRAKSSYEDERFVIDVYDMPGFASNIFIKLGRSRRISSNDLDQDPDYQWEMKKEDVDQCFIIPNHRIIDVRIEN